MDTRKYSNTTSYRRREAPQPALRGFTLIELLVVVAIIALLIAILLPSVGKAKEQAKSVVCSSNMKELIKGTIMYCQESGDTGPVNGLLFPKPFVPTMYQSNSRFLPYVRNAATPTDWAEWTLEKGQLYQTLNSAKKAFMCPSDTGLRTYGNTAPGGGPLTKDEAGTVRVGPNGGGYWSYSVNTVFNSMGRFRNRFTSLPWVDPLKTITIQNPSNFITFVEEADDRSGFNDEVIEPPAYRQADSSEGADSKLSGRHNGGGNIGFWDAHVEWFNEVLFNNQPSVGSGNEHWYAMQSPYTKMFFPDGGQFATPP